MAMDEKKKVEDTFWEMLYVLQNEKLTNEDQQRHIKEMYYRTVIQFQRENLYHQSACIISKPALIHNEPVIEEIILKLGYHPNSEYHKYIIYHELSHLISIGKIIQTGDYTYSLPWGICYTKYVVNEKKVLSHLNRQNYALNEKMNDCLACFMYSEIEKRDPSIMIQYKRGMLATFNQKELIRDYINHIPRSV